LEYQIVRLIKDVSSRQLDNVQLAPLLLSSYRLDTALAIKLLNRVLIEKLTTSGAAPKVIDAKYSYKDATLLEVDSKLAQIDLEFDSDLYISRSVNCGAFDCSLQDSINTSCFCNYASHENCGYVPPECGVTCGILSLNLVSYYARSLLV
jgi:hypothetical protein